MTNDGHIVSKQKPPARSRAVSASQFKATCLGLMDEVAQAGIEIVITKHRRPVAKLAPIAAKPRISFVNRSPGMIHVVRDSALMAPIHPGWEVDADL